MKRDNQQQPRVLTILQKQILAHDCIWRVLLHVRPPIIDGGRLRHGGRDPEVEIETETETETEKEGERAKQRDSKRERERERGA